MSTASSITMGGGGGSAPTAHIMVSYEWGSQQKALLIKEALERRGLVTVRAGSGPSGVVSTGIGGHGVGTATAFRALALCKHTVPL